MATAVTRAEMAIMSDWQRWNEGQGPGRADQHEREANGQRPHWLPAQGHRPAEQGTDAPRS